MGSSPQLSQERRVTLVHWWWGSPSAGGGCPVLCMMPIYPAVPVCTGQPPPPWVWPSWMATVDSRHGRPALSPAILCGATSGAHPAAEGCHTQLPAHTYLLSGLLLSGHSFSIPMQFWRTHEPSSLHAAPWHCTGQEDGSQVGETLTALEGLLLKKVSSLHQTQLIWKGRLTGSLGEATSEAELATRLS